MTPSTTAQVASGGFHACAIKADATVVCWGDNGYGQSTVPAGLTSVKQITSSRYYHTCAVKTDGMVVCWGANYSYAN